MRERGLTEAEIAWASDRAEDIDERRLARRILGVLQGNMKMETAALLARFLAAHGQSERESFADYIRAARKIICSPLTDAEVEWVVDMKPISSAPDTTDEQARAIFNTTPATVWRRGK